MRLYDRLPFHGFGLWQALLSARWIDIDRWLKMLRSRDEARQPWQRFAVIACPDDPDVTGEIIPLNSPIPSIRPILDRRWSYWRTTPTELRNRSDRNRENLEYAMWRWEEFHRQLANASADNLICTDHFDFGSAESCGRGNNEPLMGEPGLTSRLRQLVKSINGAHRLLRAFHAWDLLESNVATNDSQACRMMAADFDSGAPEEVRRVDLNALKLLRQKIALYQPSDLPWLGSG